MRAFLSISIHQMILWFQFWKIFFKKCKYFIEKFLISMLFGWYLFSVMCLLERFRFHFIWHTERSEMTFQQIGEKVKRQNGTALKSFWIAKRWRISLRILGRRAGQEILRFVYNDIKSENGISLIVPIKNCFYCMNTQNLNDSFLFKRQIKLDEFLLSPFGRVKTPGFSRQLQH